MKLVAIVLFVLAGFMVLITVAGTAKEVLNPGEGVRVTLVGVLRVSQARIMAYFTRGVTWAALGACCLGLDSLLKRKASPVRAAQPASRAEAAAERARATQSAAAKPAAPARAASPASQPQAATPASAAAEAPKPASPAKPAPAIRPATDPREE